MSQRTKRSWKPRFSLKVFLLACLMIAVAVAWISQSYREYVAEQRLIDVLTRGRAANSMMTVATNGETRTIGQVLM
ncbi:MAG: hypothetical protein ACR2NZ_14105 [Rubripirellula sp.]